MSSNWQKQKLLENSVILYTKNGGKIQIKKIKKIQLKETLF